VSRPSNKGEHPPSVPSTSAPNPLHIRLTNRADARSDHHKADRREGTRLSDHQHVEHSP
jgi:hypothetical protein